MSAGVVKLVDTPDLGSGAAKHGGSSPSTRTKVKLIVKGLISTLQLLSYQLFIFYIKHNMLLQWQQ